MSEDEFTTTRPPARERLAREVERDQAAEAQADELMVDRLRARLRERGLKERPDWIAYLAEFWKVVRERD